LCKCGAWIGELGLEPTIELYLEHLLTIFAELRRVLRKEGSLWLNLGDSYANDFKWGGRTGGKHAKGLHGSQVGRTRRNTGLKPKDLMMMPARIALALQEQGWWVRSRIAWIKDACMPESTTDRPTTSYEDVYLLTKRARYFYDEFAVRESITGNTHSRGNGNSPKQTQPGLGTRANSIFQNATLELVGSRNMRNVWHIPAEPHSDCLCNACGRYYETPRGLKREQLESEPIHYGPDDERRGRRKNVVKNGPRDQARAEIGLRDSTKFGRGAGWRKPAGWDSGAGSHDAIFEGNYTGERYGAPICECGAVDWTQHFASYPVALADRCIRAGTSEKGICPECKSPWLRVVSTEREFRSGSGRSGRLPGGKNGPLMQGGGATVDVRRGPTLLRETVSWKPSCKCIREEYPDEPLTGREWEFLIERTIEKFMPLPATVLDPFGGLGSTAIATLRLGREATLIELQPQYARMAEIRITNDAPLFNHVTLDLPEAPTEEETAVSA
jgi:DNA modification methylase